MYNTTTSATVDQAFLSVTNGNASIPTSSRTLDSGVTFAPAPISTETVMLTQKPHVILTTLPSGAIFQILEGVSYTSPTYITTTSPGSDQPTIVPIIIPFVGPPKICFGCFIHFPPNIKIDVPEFCIQLFGLKIGKCPSKKKEKKKDGGKDDKDDKSASKTQKPRTSEKHSTATSTSSSSCTATITAIQKSIFCSVTRGNSADASCSTKAYTTVTECSAVSSVTTLTTTRTQTPTVPLCAPRKCGGRSCSAKDKRSQFHVVQKIVNRGDPGTGKWPDPSDHQTHEGFIVNELNGIFGGTATKPRYSPKLVKHHPEGSISADWVTFKNNVEALALEGLYGCTSIILVSQRGAWMSHIWQTVMESKNSHANEFETMLDLEISYRIPPGEPFHEYYEYGLEEMKGNQELGDPGIMFGDDAAGVDTSSSLNMRAFIVTPREWQVPGLYAYADSGQIIPHEVLNHIDHQKGTIRYPEEVERLKSAVTDFYGDIPFEVVDYNPVVPKRAHLARLASEGKLIDDSGNPMEVVDYMSFQTIGSVRGKILLQYQPASTCGDMAEWRLWVEGQPVGGRTDKWAPRGDQIFSSPGNLPAIARRQEVCELSSRSKEPAVSSPTSAKGPDSSPVSNTHNGGSNTQPNSETALSTKISLTSAAKSGQTSAPKSGESSRSDPFPSPTVTVRIKPYIPSTVTPTSLATRSSSTSTALPSSKEVIKPVSAFSKPSTVKTPSAPLPSEAVSIQYVETVSSDDNGELEQEGAWYMFPVKTDDATFDPCNKEPQGWKFLDKPIPLASVPWPPRIDAEKYFFDRRHCIYKGGNGPNGFGKLECENIPEFDCVRDPRAAKKLECEKDSEALQTFLPRVLCNFPVTSLEDEMAEIVGGPR